VNDCGDRHSGEPTSGWIFTIRAGNTLWLLIFLFILALVADTNAASAQRSQRQDPIRFVRWTGEDARSFLPSITRLQPLYIVLGGGIVYASSFYDRRATRDTRYLADREILRVLEEFGNEKVLRPMSLMIFIGTLLQPDQRMQNAAFSSMESILFANLFVNGLKSVVGRSRPNVTDDPGDFSFLSGRTAFPSGHSATVFAFLTPWVLFYPHPLMYGLFGLGAATAFTRVATGFHWVSDVVSGSAMGFGIAYWISRRHLRASGGRTRASSLSRVVPRIGVNDFSITYRF